MATLAQKIQCEQRAREMLKDGGLPEPDRIEYGHTCIRLFWEETKVVLVVDIDEPPEGLEIIGEYSVDPYQPCDPDEDPDEFGYLAESEDDDAMDDEEIEEILRRLDLGDDDEEAA